jgi:hypothetical protein
VSSNLKSHYSYKILNKVTLRIDRISEDNLTGQFYANRKCIESTKKENGESNKLRKLGEVEKHHEWCFLISISAQCFMAVHEKCFVAVLHSSA